jgi:hypothetical protein
MFSINQIEDDIDLSLAYHELGVAETELEMKLKSDAIDYDLYKEQLEELLEMRKKLKQKEKEIELQNDLMPKI